MTPSPLIVTSAINVVLIERRQGVRNANTSNATRNEATATKSVFKPQGSLADERDKSVVTAS